MSGTMVVEIPLDQLAGFALKEVDQSGGPGAEVGVENFALDNPSYYTVEPTEEQRVDLGIDVLVGCDVIDAEAILTGQTTLADGTVLKDTIMLKSKAAQTVGVVLGQVIFVPKPPKSVV